LWGYRDAERTVDVHVGVAAAEKVIRAQSQASAVHCVITARTPWVGLQVHELELRALSRTALRGGPRGSCGTAADHYCGMGVRSRSVNWLSQPSPGTAARGSRRRGWPASAR
jgi:hypothetical protein